MKEDDKRALPPLPSLRELTRQLRELHDAWSHPDAGGEYVGFVNAGPEVGWVLESPPHPDLIGREYVPGSVERECGLCHGRGWVWVSRAGEQFRGRCDACLGTGRVHVPAPFDATAAARRLLAAARDGGAK